MSAKANAMRIGKLLCELVGINPATCRDITITCKAGEAAQVTAVCYSPCPPNETLAQWPVIIKNYVVSDRKEGE